MICLPPPHVTVNAFENDINIMLYVGIFGQSADTRDSPTESIGKCKQNKSPPKFE